MESVFRIEKKEAFRVVGIVLHTTNEKKEGRKKIPMQWEKFKSEGYQEQILPLMHQEPYGLFGISAYHVDASDSRKFDYYIAVSSDIEEIEELTSFDVPAFTWAVFPCTIDTIAKTEVQAITKWLPRSNYKPLNSGYITGRMKAKAPDIECYGPNNQAEVWVAVIAK